MRLAPIFLLLATAASAFADAPAPAKITHSMFIAGGETAILSGDGQVLWKYPAQTRDGFVLPNGDVLMAVSHSKDYPGGAVVEMTRENKIVGADRGQAAFID